MNRLTTNAALHHALACLAHDMGDLAEARQHAEISLTIFRELNDQNGIAEALNLLGVIALDEGHLDATQPHLEEALLLLDESDHARRSSFTTLPFSPLCAATRRRRSNSTSKPCITAAQRATDAAKPKP